jgi:hypothetical protein
MEISCVVTKLFSDAKRLIGRGIEDSIVQADMKNWPFTAISSSFQISNMVILKHFLQMLSVLLGAVLKTRQYRQT